MVHINNLYHKSICKTIWSLFLKRISGVRSFVKCKQIEIFQIRNRRNTTESNKRKDTFETGSADYKFNNSKQTKTSSKLIQNKP